MELSIEVLEKKNQASAWWTKSVRVNSEAESRTIELVRAILKEVGKVEFGEFPGNVELPYLDCTGKWKLGCIKELYIDKEDDIVAILADGTETNLEYFNCLTDSFIWDQISDTLGLSEE